VSRRSHPARRWPPGASLTVACALGWHWSDEHGGFVRLSRRGYLVAETAMHACFIDGIRTPQAAALVVRGTHGRHAP
jgi:hypothetical protein